jgi:hypothetical protein
MNEEVTEHGMQTRCRDCKTGWVTVNSQDEAPSADSGSTCFTCSTCSTVPVYPLRIIDRSASPDHLFQPGWVGTRPAFTTLPCPAVVIINLAEPLFLDAKIAKVTPSLLLFSSRVLFSSRRLFSSSRRLFSPLRHLFLSSRPLPHVLSFSSDLASHRCTESPSFSYAMPTCTACCHVAHPSSLMRTLGAPTADNPSLLHLFATTHFPATSFPATLFPATSFRYNTLPCHILPYDTLPCHILPCDTPPCDILPYDIPMKHFPMTYFLRHTDSYELSTSRLHLIRDAASLDWNKNGRGHFDKQYPSEVWTKCRTSSRG